MSFTAPLGSVRFSDAGATTCFRAGQLLNSVLSTLVTPRGITTRFSAVQFWNAPYSLTWLRPASAASMVAGTTTSSRAAQPSNT